MRQFLSVCTAVYLVQPVGFDYSASYPVYVKIPHQFSEYLYVSGQQ